MFNLEKEIKNWLRLFRKHQAFDHGNVREMELHLRDHIEDLISSGKTEKDAFETAVKAFGEIPIIAVEEFSNYKRKTTVNTIIRTAMLNSYFKTTFRGLMKNPMSSLINVFGLATAIGICIVVYAFVDFDFSVDNFHKNKNDIYLATFFADRDGAVHQYGLSPTPLGEMLQLDYAAIKRMCRIEDHDVVMKHEDDVYHEKVRYVDAAFLQMFTFPLKWGEVDPLNDPNGIVLSEEMAIKYFGPHNPVGQDILMIFDEDKSKVFKITGVAEAFPRAHAIGFDFLVNFDNLKVSNPDYDLSDWRGLLNATLIQVENPEDIRIIKAGTGKYVSLQNQAEKNWSIASFEFVPLASLHKQSKNIRNDISFGTREEGWVILSILGIFMLALACFNYINIAIVSASKRLKEIGVRKVIGANQKSVIIQFLAENVLVTFLALVFGVFLGVTFFIPWFNTLFNYNFALNPFHSSLWIFLAAILLFTAVLSGLYPALYISKFNAINIFKGTVKFGKKNPLTKILLAFQLVLACILITNGVMLTQNSAYQAKRGWGYNQKNAIYVSLPNHGAVEQLMGVMSQNPNVLSLSGSTHHMGKAVKNAIISRPDRQFDVLELAVDSHYLETMGVELATGRFFNEHPESDKQSVIINELLQRQLDMEAPIGQVLKLDSSSFQIVGVVKNFHINDFNTELKPTIFKVADQTDYRYLSMRVKDGADKETYETVQKQWAILFPEIPFEGGHQADLFTDYYVYMDNGAKFMAAIGIIAMLLASLGLYGLVTLNVSGRVREFSIRKVLGAGRKSITTNITGQYVALTVTALVIGAPLSFILVQAELNTFFEYHMPTNYSGVVLAVLILIVVLMATVSTQVLRVFKANAVEGLKVE